MAGNPNVSDLKMSISKDRYPIINPVRRIISNLQGSHGFSKQSADGTQSNDTSIYHVGTQSLKLVTDGDNNAVFTRKSSMSPTIDLTGKYIVLWLRITNVSKITELALYLSSNNMTAYYRFLMHSWKLHFVEDTWTQVTLPFGAADITGSPDRAAINSVQLRVRDDGTGAVTVWLGEVSYQPEPTAGVCSVVFDDNWESEYTEGLRYMSQKGIPGTIYTMPNSVGQTNYMTIEQLRDAHDNHGWCIAGHHELSFANFSTPQCERELTRIKSWLTENGFADGASHFAYPNGYFNTDILEIANRLLNSARSINDTKETVVPADRNKLRTLLVNNTTTPTEIADAVTSAITNKEWLILTFHKLVTSPTTSTEYSIANFETVIDDLVTQGIACKTVAEVMQDNKAYSD